jgi:hypothetical protein
VNQKQLIINHCVVAKDHSISPLEAKSLYRIERLAARIKDLKNDGYNFIANRRYDPTGRPYTRYTFADAA